MNGANSRTKWKSEGESILKKNKNSIFFHSNNFFIWKVKEIVDMMSLRKLILSRKINYIDRKYKIKKEEEEMVEI